MGLGGAPGRALAAARALLLVAWVAWGTPAARGEEGFWPLDRFPADETSAAYGFRPDAAWLERVRSASLRLAGGCSAGLVSPAGLLITNQHCVAGCLRDVSAAGRDVLRDGFLAADWGDERRCPGLEADQLLAIADATGRVAGALGDRAGAELARAERAVRAALEAECEAAAAGGSRCELVRLDEGARHALHRYQRFRDVRLVFAPEAAAALFGGEGDNFEFPRHAFDVAFLRLYADGAPAATAGQHLALATTPLRAGELTLVSGHPASTSRHETLAQLAFRRDVALPQDLSHLGALREVLLGFEARGPDERRVVTAELGAVENSLKALKGRRAALESGAIAGARQAAEAGLRARTGDAPFAAIEEALARYRDFRPGHVLLEGGQGFRSRLFGIARALVRADGERAKAERAVLSEAPLSLALERATLGFSLARLRDALGPDHPLTTSVLARETPEALAARLVDGTELADPAVRRRLLAAGGHAIEASEDPMLAFARAIDLHARLVRARYEIGVEAVVGRAAAEIARARLAALGAAAYPDATGTLRLSYGAVRGYAEPNGRMVGPFTTLAGAFRRHTGREPLALPASWLAARDAVSPGVAFGFASTNDVVGGSSGSPVLNRAGELVGVVFDGNAQSLGGELAFDAELSRAVSLSASALRDVLAHVYRADRLLAELGGADGGGGTAAR